ncbi:hypothetical protein [Serratia fonticola]|uniref:hypothetical protein n=1 Tax=Serratia fonticola TaxID=47917 RepID=UPI001377D04D|nr:hypothetical protein [Serratia fonticola]NCG54045.1 hypothetical protein [Serratia fonticola]
MTSGYQQCGQYHMLQPGHLGHAGWDVLGDMATCPRVASLMADTLAGALIPEAAADHVVARGLFSGLLQFSAQTGYLRDIAEVAVMLMAIPLPILIAQLRVRFPDNMHVLLMETSLQGRSDLALSHTLGHCLGVFRSPTVAFALSRPGFTFGSLSATSPRSLFLAPGIRDMMDVAMMTLYRALLVTVLRLAASHAVTLRCFMPMVTLANGHTQPLMRLEGEGMQAN